MSYALSIAPREARSGVVSIVIVNYRGAEDTITCLESLRTLNWPAAKLEIIVVDNDSGDDSVERIRAAAPDVLLVESEVNTGFAGGCNLGVANATGEFIALINSDARPDPEWLNAGAAVLRADITVAAVASKVVDWDGKLIDFVDGKVNFQGQGYKLEAGKKDLPEYNDARDVLFFTGSAAILRASIFRLVGGFDEQYFMFFEDVDLGWRLNLLGYRVRYVPGSLVYHRHHAAIKKFGGFRERYLLERNALLTIWKNFDDVNLNRSLAPALLMAIRNAMLLGAENTRALDLQITAGGDDDDWMRVNKLAMATVHAIDYLGANLGSLQNTREAIQSVRARKDTQIPGLINGMLQSVSGFPQFLDAWNKAIEVFELDTLYATRRKIAVITMDTLTQQMAGPAIRAFHIAEELAREHEVTLVSTTTCTISHPKMACRYVNMDSLQSAVADADIIIFQGFVMHKAPWIEESDKVVIVDIYDPIHLEQLEQTKADEPNNRAAVIRATTQVLNEQLLRGDFFMCASEEQRHFWLGQMAALYRLNPDNYDRDSTMSSLLAVVPFGMPSADPVRNGPGIRDVEGIGPDDKVIIWAGGVYNWFDPLTLIRAVHQLAESHPDVRLFFLGMKHPNPHVPEMKVAWETRELSDRLGLTDKHVFFNDRWVDYNDRQNYLLDADLGVSTHFEHVETTFSFRTRMLDYLWARLPIVATEGDTFGRLIESEKLGISVPQEDVGALTSALEKALYDDEFIAACKANVERMRSQFVWERVLEPLRDFCRSAERAADLVSGRRMAPAMIGPGLPGGRLARNLYYARARYQEGGLRTVAERGVAKARRLVVSPED
jgi:GT2 family glycosyltransferase/glycosyltransferase involved in cell wall biosynthesis